MRRAIVLSILIVAVSFSLARGQTNRLEFHSDEALSSCELAVTTEGLIKVHVLITGNGGGVFGINFRAVKPACMGNAVWLADVWFPPVVSDALSTQDPGGTGIIFDCAEAFPPVYVGWILYSVTDPPATCCMYEPDGGENEALPMTILCGDPGFSELPMEASGIVMNPDETCRCDSPLATESTTWGAVKALYR